MSGRSPALLGIVLALVTFACSDSTSPRPSVHGTARFYNGATPAPAAALANAAVPAEPSATAVVPGNGTWLLSPDRITMRLIEIGMGSQEGGPGSDPQAVDCLVTYDKSRPGLTQIGECPFSVDSGTYTQLNLYFAGSYDIVIDDAVHGFYTTAGGIVTSPPAGGVQPWTFNIPIASEGRFGPSPFVFPTPLVVSQTTPLSLSVVISALHAFSVNVAGGAVSVSSGHPQVPYISAAVGELANVEFYSREGIGTAESYCAFMCGLSSPTGVISVTVYYASANTPIMGNVALNGNPPGCNFGMSSVNSPKAYMGLDAGGSLGWAMAADQAYLGYAAEMRMARLSTIGGTTTLYCKARTTDPAPPGGSYASGAPDIAQPANALGTFILVGR